MSQRSLLKTIILLLISTMLFAGCFSDFSNQSSNKELSGEQKSTLQPSPDSTKKSTSTQASPTAALVIDAQPLKKEDFNIDYHGFTINDEIPIEKITGKLGFGEGHEENNYGLISQNNGVKRFGLFYPDRKHTELRLVFVDVDEGMLVFADLITLPTARGIKVGDSIDKLFEKYGTANISQKEEMVYAYQSKKLLFNVDKETKKIKAIMIDYNSEKANQAQEFNK